MITTWVIPAAYTLYRIIFKQKCVKMFVFQQRISKADLQDEEFGHHQ